VTTGTTSVAANGTFASFGYSQGFATGHRVVADLEQRNGEFQQPVQQSQPNTVANLNLTVTQQLLQGFGLAVNRRKHSDCQEHSESHGPELQAAGDRHGGAGSSRRTGT